MKLNLTLLLKDRGKLYKALLLCGLTASSSAMLATELADAPLASAPGTESVWQQQKVTGCVVDSNGEAIIGANVMVKGKNTGSITDINGNFSVEVDNGDVLTITYIGYQTQEVTVTAGKSLRITLRENVETLDEVVIVGFGSQKKANLTGSVSQVKMEDVLGDRPVANTMGGLPGNMPGLYISGGSTP